MILRRLCRLCIAPGHLRDAVNRSLETAPRTEEVEEEMQPLILCGAPEGLEPQPRIQSPMLYPIELRARGIKTMLLREVRKALRHRIISVAAILRLNGRTRVRSGGECVRHVCCRNAVGRNYMGWRQPDISASVRSTHHEFLSVNGLPVPVSEGRCGIAADPAGDGLNGRGQPDQPFRSSATLPRSLAAR